MASKLRIFVALLILAVSIGLLVWGFMPMPRETIDLPVEPSNLTLPTPASYLGLLPVV